MRQSDSARPCLALIAALGLAACTSGGTPGAEQPPTTLGKLNGTRKACAALEGSFSWEAKATLSRHDFRSLPGAGTDDLPLGPGMQVWITRGGSGSLVMRTRLINRDPKYSTRAARDWKMATYKASQFECDGGMLVFAPRPVHSAEETSNWGSKGLSRGFRLGMLQDGSLALGLQNVSTERTKTLFTWADVSVGHHKAPDVVRWEWINLPRIRDGAGEPEPVDANIR